MNKPREDSDPPSSDHNDTEKELLALREALDEVTSNQISLRQELEESRNSFAQLAEQLQKSRAAEEALEARVDSDACRIEGLRDKLSAAEVTIAESARATCLEEQAAANEEALNLLKGELETLAFKKNALERSLKARIAGDTAKIADLREKLLAAELAVAESVQTSGSERMASAAEEALKHLKSEVENLKSEKADLGGRVEKAEQLLEQARKEAAAFAAEAHNLKDRLLASETALTASNESLKAKVRNETTLYEELDGLRGEVLALRGKLSESNHAHEAERAKVRALAADLDAAQRGHGVALRATL